MAFEIQPFREYLVRPALPAPLVRLQELAYNIVWAWEPAIRAVFRRLDPVLWKECGYNPTLMLGRVSQQTLDRAAGDARYLGFYQTACQRFDAHLQRPAKTGDKLIAYFSAEYGLTECLPVYSGGLGILSGDHMKSASDLDLGLVGVGLLYQRGYFRQYLNADGWQQERLPDNDFHTLPLIPATGADGQPLMVEVELPGGTVHIRVWTLAVGRIRLLFLDTNTPANARAEDREITDQLYGGDNDTRIRQEIVLGIGGMRALEAMGLEPTVFHMNEGHSAFLGLERVRLFMKRRGLTFEEAVEATRVNNVFTTHTPVPAGIDMFEPGLVYRYFANFCQETGVDFERLMALGRRNPTDRNESFSMAVLALHTSAWRNGVSRLHGVVSREMWNDLWPRLPVTETPITSVTNGVHVPSWINGDLSDLYDQNLDPDWRSNWGDPKLWKQVQDIPDDDVLEMHRKRKRRLLAFVRDRQSASAARRKAAAAEARQAAEVLDPHALTIGFARRFATYKRATLLFRDVERLKRILCNPERPVQILIAGKAHPKDQPGKAFIREIVQLSRDPDLWKHVVFVEDYDMKVARELVQGVDVWLNNPQRGEEACGTSGMKAAINGVLNLSILDGWFDEAADVSGGWAIGDREPYSEEQDAMHASNIYYLLEREIVPLYYAQAGSGSSSDWVKRMKQSMCNLTPLYDARRMVHEYDDVLYSPAHREWGKIKSDDFAEARRRARWAARVSEVWGRVAFLDQGGTLPENLTSGETIHVEARVRLAGLAPDDVKVECVMGRIGPGGSLEDPQVVEMPVDRQDGEAAVFVADFVPLQTGRIGCAFRVSPNHFDNPLTRPVASPLKWAGQ